MKLLLTFLTMALFSFGTSAEYNKKFTAEKCPIRIAIVTARAAPAHKRVIKTLRQQKIRIDETFFLGGLPKGKFLKGFSADIFFDDLTENCQEATSHVSTGHVPYGINNSK